jgi:hypothetical protein
MPADDAFFFVLFSAIAQRGEQADRHEGANQNYCNQSKYGHSSLLFFFKPVRRAGVPYKMLAELLPSVVADF